ncbi:DUF4190 domain-containing protein [Gulosibacter macacae]|nr:DUF4190 domain-containing protein [Gulosibacter macacae]
MDAIPMTSVNYSPPPQQTGGWNSTIPPNGPPPGRGLALAALILGIVALVVAVLPIPVVPLIVAPLAGLAALILGIVALVKRQPKPQSIAGLILGVVAPVVAVIMALVWPLVGLVQAASEGKLDISSSDPAIVQENGTEAADERPDVAGFPSFDMPTDPQPIGTELISPEGFTIKVNSVREATEIGADGQQPFYDRLVIVNVTLTNNSGEEYDFSGFDWELFEDPETAFDASLSGTFVANPHLTADGFSVLVGNGDTTELDVVFDLRTESAPTVFGFATFMGDGVPVGWVIG